MAKPDPLTLRVASVTRATALTRVVQLDLAGAAFSYTPGQAATIGPEGQADVVPYSIASAPEETRRHGRVEFLVKLESSGRWGHKFTRLARGMRMHMHGPFGGFTFPPHPSERRFLFIAGGTGISPVRAMLKHLELSQQPGRARLLYSARTPQDFPYLSELRGLARRGTLELTLTATREVGGRWRGDRGRIASTHLAALVDHPETLCFVCGPTAMVNDVPVMLTELGVSRSRILIEKW